VKVLIFSTYFAPTTGGVQTCVMLLAKGLAEAEGLEASGISVKVTVVTEDAANGMDDSVLPFRVVRQPGFRKLRKLIQDSDVVHIAGPSLLPMALSWATGRPFFVEHHVYQAICPNGLLFRQPERSACPGFFSMGRYDRCLKCSAAEKGTWRGLRAVLLGFPRRWLCRRATGNIGVTDHVKKRVNMPAAQTIYHGVISPESELGGPRLEGELVQTAFVGRLVAEKGVPVLLKAIRCLQDDDFVFRLTVIGDGPERVSLERMSKELGIDDRVIFRGDLRGGSLKDALTQIPIVVMPSIWEETAGLSAIEHMMRGGVVVASDIGGLSEVIGESGLKFPPGDFNALATCLRKAARDPVLVKSLGVAARARAIQYFNWKDMIHAHLSLYRNACESLLARAGAD